MKTYKVRIAHHLGDTAAIDSYLAANNATAVGSSWFYGEAVFTVQTKDFGMFVNDLRVLAPNAEIIDESDRT